MRNRLERRKLSPLRGDGSWHDDEHDPGGPYFKANRSAVCLHFLLSYTSGFDMLQSGQHQGTPGVPCRCASNSLPSGGMGHGMTMGVIQGGLPSEQTADRFASLFLYHALPVLASCGLASIKAHREYLAGAPLALSPSGGWVMA